MCLKKRENPIDILGLSEPLCKLIDTVSCGIGKIYEPTHVRRMAKAQADQINLIAATLKNNYELPIKYKNGKIIVDSSDANDLVQRAEKRFLFEQIRKQQNIESVVDVAYQELENEKEVSKEPVDSDWISSFFNFVANVSDEKMQCLWGKLLAGEIKEPGRFSIRTLDVLRKMSQKEAISFQYIAPFVLHCVGDETKTFFDYFLLAGDFSGKYGIPFPKILDLSDVGLITSDTGIAIGFSVQGGDSEKIFGINKSIKVVNTSSAEMKIVHNAFLLTEAGRQLLSISLIPNRFPPDEYYVDSIKELKEEFALLGEDHADKDTMIYEIEELA